MPIKIQNRLIAPNLEVEGARLRAGLVAVPDEGFAAERGTLAIRRDVFHVQDLVVPVEASPDYASVKVCDLPANRLLVLGALAALTIEGSEEIADITAVDFSLGTAATASTSLSGDAANLIAKVDAGAQGVVSGAGPASLAALAAGNKAVYANWVAAVESDAEITVSGRITLVYIDLGAA